MWKSVIASFLGNVIRAALLALPLVYLHGGDEWDPSEGARVGMVKGGAVSPGGMWVNEVTLPGSGTVSARGNDKWGKDIEAQTPA